MRRFDSSMISAPITEKMTRANHESVRWCGLMERTHFPLWARHCDVVCTPHWRAFHYNLTGSITSSISNEHGSVCQMCYLSGVSTVTRKEYFMRTDVPAFFLLSIQCLGTNSFVTYTTAQSKQHVYHSCAPLPQTGGLRLPFVPCKKCGNRSYDYLGKDLFECTKCLSKFKLLVCQT